MIHYFLQQELKDGENLLGFLKQQSKKDLQKIKPNLTELQNKWLAGYLQEEYTLDELQQTLKRKYEEKGAQLAAVLRYLNTEGCRRTFLLNYFGEEEQLNKPFCCDFCGLHGKIILEPAKNQTKNLSLSKSWQERLKNLFII